MEYKQQQADGRENIHLIKFRARGGAYNYDCSLIPSFSVSPQLQGGGDQPCHDGSSPLNTFPTACSSSPQEKNKTHQPKLFLKTHTGMNSAPSYASE